MTRQEKYPNTQYFTYYNANPKGRITTDCVYRAISTALNQDYNTTVIEIAKMACETGYAPDDSKGIDKYLISKGWCKHKQPRRADNTKYTGREFCQSYPKDETYIANIGGGHIVCIKNGKVLDTWNSTDGCIGNYWIKN